MNFNRISQDCSALFNLRNLLFPESRDQKLKYNVDCPLLMSEYIRGVTIRGFFIFRNFH